MIKTNSRFFLLALLGTCMAGVSAYLTSHYYAVKFPSGLNSGSLCNINSFFNCDKTILSDASSIAGVPISVFGMLIGLLVMGSVLFRGKNFRSTLLAVLILNLIGCLALFSYSLFVLRGLCPFCTVYYVLSGVVVALLYKENSDWRFDLKVLTIFALIFLAGAAGARSFGHSLERASQQTASVNEAELLAAFAKLPKAQRPTMTSDYKLANAPGAPIQMQIFSDFECPGCGAFSRTADELKVRYAGKIDIEYFFYPLDMACNPDMKRPLHRFACRAAYIAACLPMAFERIHDELFKNQENFSDRWMSDFAARNGVAECAAKPETKEKVQSYIRAANTSQVNVTPTFLINGTKFEGGMSSGQLVPLLDALVKQEN